PFLARDGTVAGDEDLDHGRRDARRELGEGAAQLPQHATAGDDRGASGLGRSSEGGEKKRRGDEQQDAPGMPPQGLAIEHGYLLGPIEKKPPESGGFSGSALEVEPQEGLRSPRRRSSDWRAATRIASDRSRSGSHRASERLPNSSAITDLARTACFITPAIPRRCGPCRRIALVASSSTRRRVFSLWSGW